MTKKKPIPRELRKLVFERDNYTCRYCGQHADRPHCDHVYPESRGGATELSNLVTACRKCNIQKHAAIGVWPMPVDFLNRIDTLTNQADMADSRRREMEAQSDRVADMIGRSNLYAPLLYCLGAAMLFLFVVLIGVETNNPAALWTGLLLTCFFTVLSVTFRLVVGWIDREHTKAMQALKAHKRFCNTD